MYIRHRTCEATDHYRKHDVQPSRPNQHLLYLLLQFLLSPLQFLDLSSRTCYLYNIFFFGVWIITPKIWNTKNCILVKMYILILLYVNNDVFNPKKKNNAMTSNFLRKKKKLQRQQRCNFPLSRLILKKKKKIQISYEKKKIKGVTFQISRPHRCFTHIERICFFLKPDRKNKNKESKVKKKSFRQIREPSFLKFFVNFFNYLLLLLSLVLVRGKRSGCGPFGSNLDLSIRLREFLSNIYKNKIG